MSRATRIILFCLWLTAGVILGGCASKVLYNHADWLLTWQIDRYFDLSRSQRSFVSTRLSALLEHHRHDALPRYEAVIHEAAIRIQRGLTDEDVEWAIGQYDLLRVDLLARFAPDGAEFLRLVHDPQLPHVQGALNQRLAEQEGLLHEPVRTRLEGRKDRVLKLVREWLGPLSNEQERQIAELAMAFPDTAPLIYAHQRRRNDQLMALLKVRMQQDTPDQLRAWLIDQEADQAFLDAIGEFRHHLKGLVLAIDRMATSTQRRHLLSKLDDLARTVRKLHNI
ncbi:MAG TPA: DUF6279 family lipoprotein [Nitrospira sp.]